MGTSRRVPVSELKPPDRKPSTEPGEYGCRDYNGAAFFTIVNVVGGEHRTQSNPYHGWTAGGNSRPMREFGGSTEYCVAEKAEKA